ncbi:chloramphenicol acetyltransferase [Maritimibacter sp. UBA3975]|uniref:chloramphenicol acetyltransferase n=1 Tax=Maritimibacter sp. UBA3975 TaxID=1946833 RepID=UPI000C096DB2|nr:chloramphenicol acetyltransferase [Maritimibacter sp. UBA3975]MAM63167.1 chloramphenicol acetyltransferase [Maritimibacter sp.]|tara:strand:+ start:35532 stop:36143 length:612 start_codon:yes stop_codon:yes gene_type:complete
MAKLGDDPVIHAGAHLHEVTMGRFVEIGEGSRVLHTHIDDYSYCDRYAEIANARIGKFANIAAFSRIGPTDHPMDRASQHHFLYRSADYWDDAELDADFFARRAARTAHIGHDTWIGHNAVVKPEVTVGHGAVVAAQSMVTRDVAPYTIVAGVPARPIRARFPDAISERLMALAWWDWDHATLRARLDDFRNMEIEAFLEKYA